MDTTRNFSASELSKLLGFEVHEDYWDKLSRISHDTNTRLYRTDVISKELTIYNVLVLNRLEPFLKIRAKTLSMMEYARG